MSNTDRLLETVSRGLDFDSDDDAIRSDRDAALEALEALQAELAAVSFTEAERKALRRHVRHLRLASQWMFLYLEQGTRYYREMGRWIDSMDRTVELLTQFLDAYDDEAVIGPPSAAINGSVDV